MDDNKNVENTEELKSYAGTNMLMLIIREICAGYILYLSWTLIDSYMEGKGLPLVALIICVFLFVVIAGYISIVSLKALIRGEYSGGKADEAYNAYMKAVEAGEIDESEEDKSNMLLSERLQKYNDDNE